VDLIVSRRPTIRRREVQAAVSPMSVVMIDEFGEDALEVTRIQDQQPIEALGTNGADESFCDPICRRRLNRRPDDSNTNALKHLIKASREFAIVIAHESTNRFGTLRERPRHLTGLLRH